MTRRGRLRYIADGVGRPLPESISDRIRNDLTGSTATPGHLMRSVLAFLAVYAGVALLLPGSPAIRAAALVLAVVLALVDSFAFINMNTQRRPAQRYRAEDQGNARSARRHEHEREQYERNRNDGKRRGTSTSIASGDDIGRSR
ncbi:MAG: hypothetical protein QOG99_2784 [Frankiales bacterium]|jgi:hypothetical protein|nr:hypothetical protein [Frankiales bacterium]